jgi:hypothetical protein
MRESYTSGLVEHVALKKSKVVETMPSWSAMGMKWVVCAHGTVAMLLGLIPRCRGTEKRVVAVREEYYDEGNGEHTYGLPIHACRVPLL